MKRSWKKKILGGLSLTTALFVFQACYGTPQDFGGDLLVEGLVKSKTSGLPIQGIKVSGPDAWQFDMTDADGRFSFYTYMLESLKIKFEDVDGSVNGLYANKDTVLTSTSTKIFLDIKLENK